MKVWIVIGCMIAAVGIAGLGAMVYRNLDSGSDSGTEPLGLSSDLARLGLQVANAQGCIACHTLDGSRGIGPSWLGMYGATRKMRDGSELVVDEEYIRESITRPEVKIVEGYENLMIRYNLPEEDIRALVEFTKELGEGT